MSLDSIWRKGSSRMALLFVAYTGVISFSHWLAYELRFDFGMKAQYAVDMLKTWPWVTGANLMALVAFKQFSGLLSYFSIPDMKRIVFATGSASGAALVMFYLQSTLQFTAPPRGVILTEFLLITSGVTFVRLTLRMVRERYLGSNGRASARARRVGILGAGDVGANLARELLAKRGLGLVPVAFFDDDEAKWRSRVHGIPVVGAPEVLRENQPTLRLEEAIIAMPSAPPRRIQEIIRVLQEVHVKFETVPSVDQLATGKVRVSRLRPVEIQDLLGRAPVSLATDNIRQLLRERSVMVTGAGGSIGSELCRQITAFDPKRLLMVEQSEGQLFQIEQELIEQGSGGIVLPLVADILDAARMRYIFGRFRPDVIFHAAAHKHVPMMESQPGEAVKNNTVGTAQLAELALEFQVDRFVMISTDKAINPTNVMGATKRLAEIFVQALHAANPDRTKFMAVRFGNVLGSSGSVVPLFQRQIASGGPVKVTHPDVTRYFMTIPEAVGLVLQSAAQGVGGEIFLLDMGKPVRIVDLARQMIELSGLRADEDIQIEFVGLRPGEKLFEELSYEGENYAPTQHPKIMRFFTQPMPLEEARRLLVEITTQLHAAEVNQLKLLLKRAVPEYQPYLTS